MGSDSEGAARLREIIDGPWAKEAAIAWGYLQPQTARRGRQELGEILRPHWIKPVTKQREIEIRDSLDQALLELQLLELAASTGYLDVPALQPVVEQRLDGLLWSEEAREFVRTYRYYGVMLVAERVGRGFGLPPGIRVPEVDARQAIRFASFLSVYRETYESDEIRMWQDRLDDYVYEEEDFADFENYLKCGKEKAPQDEELAKVFRGRAFGMATFIERFGDFFETIGPADWPRFGLVPLYWLEKLFGYESQGREFYYDAGLDWSTDDLLFGRALLPGELPEETRKEAVQSLQSKTARLRSVLLATHQSLFGPAPL